MVKQSKIKKMMEEPLPPISYQKKLKFRITEKDAISAYKILNKELFNNILHRPEILIKSHCQRYWGMCYGYVIEDKKYKTSCKIELIDKWCCKHWFINILAHEMMHQYQWDIEGVEREKNGKNRLLSHGPSFFKFKKKFQEHGIFLKKCYSKNQWFKYQKFK